MYLKNLTVLGFKSFADKTSLNFLPGVTAIVGPNGCGKSNVSDAIRWVLGEQSAKALRGGEMADVIFNGTDGRKPLGMAEVSLTIGDVDDEHLRAAGVEVGFNEVTITRRVFRDGGSEYFINRTACRLKDIQQLFMGTGMGRTSYSIMAQGNITQLLSSKPEDRRLVFEEAAGITKFKAQKKEALRKLEYTEQNLLRVEDLIKEVKRHKISLERQAGKAKRYKAIANELQQLDTQLARHEFDVLQSEITERTHTAEQLRRQIETVQADVLRGEDEIGQLRERLSELEQEISATQQRGLELKSESDRHESRIHFNEERLRELAAQNEKALSDINQAEERGALAQTELDSLSQRLQASEAALIEHRVSLEKKQAALKGIEEELRIKQEALRVAQAEAFSAAQELARVRNEITALDLQKQGNIVRLEKLSAEKIQLEEERTRLSLRLGEFQANVETEKLNVQTARGTVEERQARLKEIHEELKVVSQQQEQLLREQAQCRSRLEVLEQLEAGHEGFSAGALAALKQSEHVLGSLADRLNVPDRFVTAIEAALGQNLQLVLTEHTEAAEQILAGLSSERKGRASVAPLALTREGGAGVPEFDPQLQLNGEPLEAMRVVGGDPSIRPLLARLLGATRVVPDLAAATTAWKACNGVHQFVTVTGEFLSAHGVYTGGSTNDGGKAPQSILGRKNQISELKAALEAIHEKVEATSRQRGALQSEQTELQASLQEAQSDLRAQEVAIATHEGEVRALTDSHRLLGQKIETVVFEVQSLAAQEEEGLQKRAALAERIAALETREQERATTVAGLTENLETLRGERDTANSTLTESKVAFAAEEQLLGSLRQQRGAIDQRLRELTQLVAQRRGEMSAFVTRKEHAEAEIQQSRGEMDRLQHLREQVNEQAAALLAQKQAQETDINAREESLREQRRRLGLLTEQRSGLDVEVAQKQMSVQNLRERVQQKYHVNLDDVRSETIKITYADSGPARVEIAGPDEVAAAGLGTDWEVVRAQVEALQKRIDEMGPVNLVAIEEYEETEQRFTFLSQQHADLVTAKTELVEVLGRINVQTREMFVTTFNQIRENFRVMFTEIFGGGKADLILVDENDVLESGIDIVARPPGKQLQSISLLSGGEQTMTAVALLFSIYQVKPSPFCVLDELDAPLDESNINRFVRVLQRFLEHSQFIIITHNKRTIGMADVLYGVTMQEHGVSRIVSVKFHKKDEPVGEASAAAPLVPPPAAPPIEAEEDSPHRRDETVDIVMAK
ncbi:MAG TPA: chromosome segregation protein SMC [Verrucomicrobiae bacterium]|nr:chromosome segregation protein SMC [Verrucomicrobiae bacterium]